MLEGAEPSVGPAAEPETRQQAASCCSSRPSCCSKAASRRRCTHFSGALRIVVRQKSCSAQVCNHFSGQDQQQFLHLDAAYQSIMYLSNVEYLKCLRWPVPYYGRTQRMPEAVRRRCVGLTAAQGTGRRRRAAAPPCAGCAAASGCPCRGRAPPPPSCGPTCRSGNKMCPCMMWSRPSFTRFQYQQLDNRLITL